MFHAALDSTKTWRQIIDALATLLTEVHFVVSDRGLTLTQYDSSRAAMIYLSLPNSVFQEYICTDEYVLCLGIDELVRVSRRMAGDDHLEFDLDENEKRFRIRMIGQSERTFRLQLLTPPEERTQSLSPSFDIRAEMFSDGFKQAVKDIGVVSNHLRVTAAKDGLRFTGAGDTGEAEVLLKVGEDSALSSLNADAEVSSMYALSYLSEISKAISSERLVLQMAANRPIVIEFTIAERGEIRFLLAPRIERR
jgi:proliferating cell nuclear antigen PCNA